MLRPLLPAVAISLAACSYFPQPVGGVPSGEPWMALPLKRWLAEDRVVPRAVAGCASPDCPERLAVGVFSARGEDAVVLEQVLDDPERLARALRNPPSPRVRPGRATRPKAPMPVEVRAEALREGRARGFLVVLAHPDGERPPVYGAALGIRGPDGLGVVLVVGASAAAVTGTARRAARANLSGV